MQHLRSDPPTRIGGLDVAAIHDLADGATGLPPTNGLVIELAATRLVIRPSGTEPKMKVYGEVVAETDDDADVATTRASARAQLRRVLDAAVRLVCAFDADPATAPSEPRPEIDRVFSAASAGRSRRDDLALVVRCIDLTTLEGDDTAARVRTLCAQARRPDAADPALGPVAAVCVYPELVPLAAELLRGTPVGVASVAGAFPAGLSSLAVRLADIADAVGRGADEVDIVINRSALLEGRNDVVAAELEASRGAAGTAHLKVILEVGELDERRITTAAHLAMNAGADFIKTSTGKTGVNATPRSVWTMAEAIRSHAEETGRRVGLKIAGGVRTADDALGYVNIARSVLGEDWLTPELLRFGASSLLDAVVAELDATRGSASTP